ncbi:TVP38/TMEM64 family protein [Agaribacterium haliotis]|uniref:TVP38/TMEM64 family protein n=1 Tax=Agaribacterium haliotis TaxID=2013869 RepID=UPI000BB59810|nr:VTT domain-containing protein [Agaribacterium haliotis]
MRALLKVIVILALLFAATFVLIKSTGLLSVAQIEAWLTAAKDLSPLYVGSIVALLLFADLFIAVPTLTVTILAGYFLGYSYGALSALLGMQLAGCCGYVISRRFGDSVFCFLLKDENKRAEAIASFQRHGFAMILLSRALPILPEVCACLAGMTRMPFLKFISAWSLSTTPYVLIAAYAGSLSSLENPKPAILTAIFMSFFLWCAWFIYHHKNKKVRQNRAEQLINS